VIYIHQCNGHNNREMHNTDRLAKAAAAWLVASAFGRWDPSSLPREPRRGWH
jgi:hypothetical protein